MNNTILVVDDDVNLLEMISEGLSEHSYRVIVSEHPEEAMRKIKNVDVRFALLDYDLNVPGLNGVDLAQKIRFQAPDVIILIMTGYQNIKFAVEAMRNFKFDYMIKPFRIDQVISAFERSLREYELVEENKSLYRSILELEEEVASLKEQLNEKDGGQFRVVNKTSKKMISNSKAIDTYKKQQSL
jgi:DNA-binding NtrC family response regulator